MGPIILLTIVLNIAAQLGDLVEAVAELIRPEAEDLFR